MAIPLGEGAFLGLVQGTTEFLPLSSDGHLALAQLLFYGGGREDTELAAAVLLHIGTLAATVVVLRRRVWSAVEEGLRGLGRPALLKETPGGRDAMFVAIASVPTAVVGLALRHRAEESFGSLYLIGACFLASALIVAGTKLAPAGTRTTPGWTGALLVGMAQGSAVLPGLSRPAITIASLLWLGVATERAFELSFLASIPAIAGAIALESHHALRGDEAAAAIALGVVVAFLVGVGGLHVARRVVANGKLHWFAFYLVPVAIATLAWGYARP
jgi:undecaprenyl-diphosphatase